MRVAVRVKKKEVTYMELGLQTLASSSSGNCYLVKSEKTNIILDVGIGIKKLNEKLAEVRLGPEEINGVLLTHEHIDHVRSLGALTRKASDVTVYATKGTIGALTEKTPDLAGTEFMPVTGGQPFMVGDIRVVPFNVSHDTAEPVAYAFEKGGRKAAVVTDTGFVSDEIFENIKDADLLVLEANHERNILLYGRYPYPVKHRILSDLGHLSNEAAAECLARMLAEMGGSKIPRVLLAHLSKENNTPQQAMITVRNVLEEAGFYVGKDLELEVADREETGRFLAV